MKVGDIITGTFSPGSLFLITKKTSDGHFKGIGLKGFNKRPETPGDNLWTFLPPLNGKYKKVATSPLSKLELLVFGVINEI